MVSSYQWRGTGKSLQVVAGADRPLVRNPDGLARHDCVRGDHETPGVVDPGMGIEGK